MYHHKTFQLLPTSINFLLIEVATRTKLHDEGCFQCLAPGLERLGGAAASLTGQLSPPLSINPTGSKERKENRKKIKFVGSSACKRYKHEEASRKGPRLHDRVQASRKRQRKLKAREKDWEMLTSSLLCVFLSSVALAASVPEPIVFGASTASSNNDLERDTGILFRSDEPPVAAVTVLPVDDKQVYTLACSPLNVSSTVTCTYHVPPVRAGKQVCTA